MVVVEIEGFKTIESLRVELKGLTILLGPPASGKSNILEAIALLGYPYRFALLNEEYDGSVESVRPRLSKILRGGLNGIFSFGAERPVRVRALVGDASYSIELSQREAKVSDTRADWLLEIAKEDGREPSEQDIRSIDSVRDRLLVDSRLYSYNRFRVYDVISCVFSGEGQAELPKSILREDAANIKVVLASLRDAILEVNEILGRKLNTRFEAVWLRDRGLTFLDNYYEISPEMLSETTCRLLYYSTALKSSIYYARAHGLNAGKASLVVLLEEPDLYVFPMLVEAMASNIKEAVEKGVRVVVSTHNPLFASSLLSRVEGSKAYYVTRDSRGHTVISEPGPDKLAGEIEPIRGVSVAPVVEVQGQPEPQEAGS